MMPPKVYVMRVGDTSLGNLVRDCSADGTCVCVSFPSLFLDIFLIVPFGVAIRSCLLRSACLSLTLSPASRNK